MFSSYPRLLRALVRAVLLSLCLWALLALIVVTILAGTGAWG